MIPSFCARWMNLTWRDKVSLGRLLIGRTPFPINYNQIYNSLIPSVTSSYGMDMAFIVKSLLNPQVNTTTRTTYCICRTKCTTETVCCLVENISTIQIILFYLNFLCYGFCIHNISLSLFMHRKKPLKHSCSFLV